MRYYTCIYSLFELAQAWPQRESESASAFSAFARHELMQLPWAWFKVRSVPYVRG